MIVKRFRKTANIQCGAKYKGGLDKLPTEVEIFTSEIFHYEVAEPGNYIVEVVVDETINCLLPTFLSSTCAQTRCPYSHRKDSKTGWWRAAYATLKRCPDVPDIQEYYGHCFQGETVERGQGPVCC